MNTDHNGYSQDAKVWIYQADRKLSNMEKEDILNQSKHFLNEWTAHGNSLKAGVDILYNVFLVLWVDESDYSASGCSIDKSVQFIKSLETGHKVNFLKRDIIAFLINEEVYLEPQNSVKIQIKSGKIGKDSIIFNNLVSTKRQMETNWKIPVRKSWLKKYLPVN